MSHVPCYGRAWMEQIDALETTSQEAAEIRKALRLGEAGGPSSLVDLGCAHGRFVPYFEGFLAHYVGIDLTEELLEKAPLLDWTTYYLGENAATLAGLQKLKTWKTEQDGVIEERHFEPFDAALSWFTSLGCLGAQKDIELFQAVHAALRPGGVFLLGILNPFEVPAGEKTMVRRLQDGSIMLELTPGLDQESLVYPFEHFLVGRTADGYELQRSETLRQQLYTANELRALLILSGFVHVETMSCDFQIVLRAVRGIKTQELPDADSGPVESLHVPPPEGGPTDEVREPEEQREGVRATDRRLRPGREGEEPGPDEAGGDGDVGERGDSAEPAVRHFGGVKCDRCRLTFASGEMTFFASDTILLGDLSGVMPAVERGRGLHLCGACAPVVQGRSEW